MFCCPFRNNLARSIGFLVFLVSCSSSHQQFLLRDVLNNFKKAGANTKNINMRSVGNTVWLSGEVASESVSEELEDIAINTDGVMTVENDIRVNPKLEKKPRRILLERLAKRIKSDPDLKNYDIDFLSEDSRVIVSGTVDSEEDLGKLVRVAREDEQIEEESHDYQFNVTVRSTPDVKILNSLEKILAKYPRDITKSIAVSVNDGLVTFSGNVSNHEHIDSILSKALMIEGVRKVKSNVVIVKNKNKIN
jgi:osmotically-inducible protein OsmY